jgi:hypothetical protein
MGVQSTKGAKKAVAEAVEEFKPLSLLIRKKICLRYTKQVSNNYAWEFCSKEACIVKGYIRHGRRSLLSRGVKHVPFGTGDYFRWHSAGLGALIKPTRLGGFIPLVLPWFGSQYITDQYLLL